MLHPEDRAPVMVALEKHLSGQTQHFDKEYRLRHGDGHFRWIHSRGTAIRHAGGKPYRMVVMDNDIHERKTIEETLIQAAEGLSSVTGEDFYQALMRSLSSILGTRDNLVCYCVGDPPTHARTLAYYSNGKFFDNFEYELAGTSCGAVIDGREIVYAPTGVCDVWPLEKEFDRDSYIGVPMFDSTGKIIGHFACMGGVLINSDHDVGSFCSLRRLICIDTAAGRRFDWLDEFLDAAARLGVPSLQAASGYREARRMR